LWERFLTDVLGMKWDKVHDEACRLEHATSPDIEKGLSSILGDVDTCPHGHSIPDGSGHIPEENAIPLADFSPGERGRIVTVDDEDSELLRKVGKLGLQPGAVATVLEKNSDGSIEINVGKDKTHLDRVLATNLLAAPLPADSSPEKEPDVPLSKLTAGMSAIIKSYTGGRTSLGRCLSLGFTPGSPLKMLENFGQGPVLVRVHDTEVALGREVASRILVSPGRTAC
jgi:Fe2+ transport system protein FeoA